jgi:feruloyl esterase
MFRPVGLLLVASAVVVLAQTPCDRLKTLSLPNATITLAEQVPAGPFQAPGTPPPPPVMLPAHCRVAIVLTPTSDSHIEVEVWLPTNWNGKFQAVGNGGWAGSVSYIDRDPAVLKSLTSAIQEGYATASTDTGHKGGTGAFVVGHPEKLIDYAYRAVHEMTVASKSILTAFYGRGPTHSYWNGCSGGGGQGLMEAWRYPNDFDGIIAGAPGSVFNVNSVYWWVSVAQAVHRTPAAFIPPGKYPLIHRAAVQACDATDGLTDGVIQDPRRCHFDPAVLKCESVDGPGCLTDAQVEAARQIYAPAVDPFTKKVIFPGLQPGSELGWAGLAGQTPPAFGTDTLKYVVFGDAQWDFRSLDLGSGPKAAGKIDPSYNALNPDLKSFFSNRGKLLLYHGWSDQLLAPESSVEYYSSVLKTLGNSVKAEDAVRLFMAPGMAHCGGGEGPNRFDALGALEAWVEMGKTPDSIIASHATGGKVDRTRPLCPYPQVAEYNGAGSIDDAANFACKAR